MAKSSPTAKELLDRLDSRHRELLGRLDELETQVEQALADFSRQEKEPQHGSLPAAVG